MIRCVDMEAHERVFKSGELPKRGEVSDIRRVAQYRILYNRELREVIRDVIKKGDKACYIG